MSRPAKFALPKGYDCCPEDLRQERYTTKQLDRMFDLAVEKGDAYAAKYLEKASKRNISKSKS
eukprot:gene10123-2289_t